MPLPAAIDDLRRQIEGGLKPVDVTVLLPVASADFAAKLIGGLPLKQKLDEEAKLTKEYEKQTEYGADAGRASWARWLRPRPTGRRRPARWA